MAISWSDVEAHAPELSTVPVAAQDNLLAFVNSALDVDEFDGAGGPRTKLAQIYLAAHYATADGLAAGGTGTVLSETAGGLTRTYGDTASLSGEGLGTTGYGLSYLSLVQTSRARAWLLL